MEMFYSIVIVVATVILILLLTVIGIILSQKNNVQVFPPSKNTCPDYWTVSGDKCVIDDKNKGIISNVNSNYNLTSDKQTSRTDSTKIFTPGFDGTKSINFKDAKWATSYGNTQECALHKWTNQNKISWDGISNYNNC